jgi:superfamily II DNA or RNA helicase
MKYHSVFRRLIVMWVKIRPAREALLARNKAMDIALNSRSKMEELREILAENIGVKTIIFTQHNSLVYKIADKFLLPSKSHNTTRGETRCFSRLQRRSIFSRCHVQSSKRWG